MIEALSPTPALVHNSMLDVLASNKMAGVLLDGLLDMPASQRNLARWVFLRPESRQTFLDWEASARHMASTLRTTATQSGDEAVQSLIGELTVGSPEFAAYWAEHRLTRPAAFSKRVQHAVVGEFELFYQSLVIPQATDQFVALYTPKPGSPSADKLVLLASWTADTANHPKPAALAPHPPAPSLPDHNSHGAAHPDSSKFGLRACRTLTSAAASTSPSPSFIASPSSSWDASSNGVAMPAAAAAAVVSSVLARRRAMDPWTLKSSKAGTIQSRSSRPGPVSLGPAVPVCARPGQTKISAPFAA
jgi:hypothetical protein